MGKTFEGVLRTVKGSGERSWLQVADWLVFGGVVLLTVTLLRYPEPRSAWRLFVLALAIVSVGISFGKSRSANVPPQIVRLAALYAGIFAAVSFASISGSTFELSGKQFGTDFLIPSLLPLLLWNHVASERRWQILMYSMAVAAIVLISANFLQYVREWRQFGSLSTDIFLHRNYSVNLVFGLSVLIWLGFAAKFGWIRWLAWVLVPITIAMIVGTGARGAWLGAAVVIATFGLITRDRTYLVVVAASLLFAALAAVAIVPSEFVAAKIQQGFDTSGRTAGTWGPALEMALAHPLLGYGFGDNVFHSEYNRLVVEKEHWLFRASMGAHSFFLSLAFSAGFPALILLVLLIFYFLRSAVYYMNGLRSRKSSCRNQWIIAGAALISSFCGVYVVMGLFENLSWNLFCFSLGVFLVWVRLVDAAMVGDK